MCGVAYVAKSREKKKDFCGMLQHQFQGQQSNTRFVAERDTVLRVKELGFKKSSFGKN